MEPLARAAKKHKLQRSPSDKIRLQAGHMLTFDELSAREDLAERHTLKRVIKNSIIKGQGLLQLPLSLAIFVAFAGSGVSHEDITNEFFVESRMRLQVTEIFGGVGTIDEWWSAVQDTGEYGLAGWLFKQTDEYGADLNRSNQDDPKFGSWARVDTYNQLQAAVRFETTRLTTDSFGTTPYACSSEFECEICHDDEDNGFVSVGDLRGGFAGNLNETCSYSSRRLEDEGLEDEGLEEARRLRLGDMTLRNYLPKDAADSLDTFTFHIYPSEPKEKILARLRYYRDRKWLDTDTQTVKISMYFLNSELGRPRLEQLTVRFFFSESGEIVYERALLPIFLKFWPAGFAGNVTMMADASFVVLLVLNTFWRAWRIWGSFVKSSMFDHISQPSTFFELLNILIGWYCMYNLWSLRDDMAKVTEKLTEVRDFGLQYPATPDMRRANEAFWEQARSSATRFESVGLLWAWYTLLLQFRFFVSFGAQPRLALVTNTIRAVVVDLIHFMIVLFPTFLTYAFAGTLLFGRRMRAFATVEQALMTCFRIMIESEYPWNELSSEYYVTAGIWSWTFIMIVAILMINMVLAIVLDVYNEVHQETEHSETVGETLLQTWNRMFYFRNWVSYGKLEKSIETDSALRGQHCVSKSDILGLFPNMPEKELDELYRQCQIDMKRDSFMYLNNKRSLVKLSGAIMETTNTVNEVVKRMNNEDKGDPLQLWTELDKGKCPASLEGFGKNFFTAPVTAKGGRSLNLVPPEEADSARPEVPADAPEWYAEVSSMLEEQKKWMDNSTLQMQKMQWQVQVMHVNKAEGSADGDEEPL